MPSNPPVLHILWIARNSQHDHPVPALARLLRQSGCQVDLVGWAEQDSNGRGLLHPITIRAARNSRREPIRLHVPSLRLVRLLATTPADVVIHRDLGPLAATVLSARVLRRLIGRGPLPSLLLLEHRLGPAGPAANVWWKRLTRRLLAASPTVALANHRAAAEELRQLGVREAKITIGWWLAGFDHQAPRPPSHPVASPIRLLMVGSLTRRKGVDYVVGALAAATRSGADLSLTIVGRGPERSALADLVEQAELQDRVRLLGAIDHGELPELFTRHDLLVMGSYEDHTGRTAIEAMSCGLPVIASSRSGIAEILVDDGVNGLIVDPTDETAFAALLTGLDPAVLERLQAGATQSAQRLGLEEASRNVLRAAARAQKS